MRQSLPLLFWLTPRHSLSRMLAESEWPAVKARLEKLMQR